MKEGFVSISLKEISVVYISHSRNSQYYYINFFETWDKWSEEAFFVTTLEDNDYLNLIEALNRVFNFEKEERDIISYGDVAYYIKAR